MKYYRVNFLIDGQPHKAKVFAETSKQAGLQAIGLGRALYPDAVMAEVKSIRGIKS
jgi:hypothetical protein